MAVTKIGLNLTELNNITVPEFNASRTAREWIAEMPEVANSSTNYLFGWGVLIAFFITLYAVVSERIGLHGFGYDEGQTFAIVSGITFIFGLLFVMVGYIQNFVPVGVLGGLFLIIDLIIIYVNNDR